MVCCAVLQSLVTQKLMFVGRTDSGKMMALRQLLSGGGGLAADGSNVGGLLPPILVFVSTKTRAQVGGWCYGGERGKGGWADIRCSVGGSCVWFFGVVVQSIGCMLG